jgi:hypothetical protein
VCVFVCLFVFFWGGGATGARREHQGALFVLLCCALRAPLCCGCLRWGLHGRWSPSLARHPPNPHADAIGGELEYDVFHRWFNSVFLISATLSVLLFYSQYKRTQSEAMDRLPVYVSWNNPKD